MGIRIGHTETKDPVYEDRFGNPITVGTKVITSNKGNRKCLEFGKVCKITDECIFVDVGFGEDYWRRRIMKNNIESQIVNREVLENE